MFVYMSNVAKSLTRDLGVASGFWSLVWCLCLVSGFWGHMMFKWFWICLEIWVWDPQVSFMWGNGCIVVVCGSLFWSGNQGLTSVRPFYFSAFLLSRFLFQSSPVFLQIWFQKYSFKWEIFSSIYRHVRQ